MWLATKGKRWAPLSSDQTDSCKRKLQRRHTPLNPPLQSVVAGSFQNGVFLRTFADHVVQKGVVQRGRPAVKRNLVVASGCSGSGMDAVALDALQNALGSERIDIAFKTAFFAEDAKDKKAWAYNVHKILAGNVDSLFPCAYGDIRSVGDPKNSCLKCGTSKCGPPLVLDIFIIGFSCKDFARCNANRKLRAGSDITGAASSPGKSADSYHGLLHLLDTTPPEIVIIENVDELTHEHHKGGLDDLLSELSLRSYDTQAFIIDCSEYVLPQVKKRLWIVALRRPNRIIANESFVDVFKTVEDLLGVFKLSGPSLPDILMPDGHTAIEKELQSRLQNTPKRSFESSSIDSHRAAWTSLGLAFRNHRARDVDALSAWFSTLTAREQDILSYVQHSHAMKFEDAVVAARLAVCDVNQSINQLALGHVGSLGRQLACTIMPRGKVWLSMEPGDGCNNGPSVHRLLHGREALLLNGFPVGENRFEKLISETKPSFLHDLGGNAFASTVVVSLVAAVLFAVDLKQEGSNETVQTVDDAAAAIILMKRARTIREQ